MSTTAIEWTDTTWNPVTGCDRTSPGCDHCYALTLAKRLKAMGSPRYQVDGHLRTSGPGFGLTMHEDKLDEPLHWRTPRRVFVNSMSDLFHAHVSDDFICKAFVTMERAHQHTFQILTKRPQRMPVLLGHRGFVRRMDDLRGAAAGDFTWPLPNVWLGTSIESDRYTFRADHLRAAPAAVRFLSLEPLLGPLLSLDLTGIDWVIVGGESGPGARPMSKWWATNIRDRCVAAGIPFLFKQWGAHGEPDPDSPFPSGRRMHKHLAGRSLDGRTWDEYPS